MKYIQQITEQLNKMSEEQKNQWILSRAKLCKEIERQGFLQTLTGEKKVPYIPIQKEIEEFCWKVETKRYMWNTKHIIMNLTMTEDIWTIGRDGIRKTRIT